MDQFILFGDSITQQCFSPNNHFGAALSNAYARKLDIINRGFSGYNTTQALQILPECMPTPQQARVRFLTIFFGANDARLPNTPGGPQQHVPLELFRENLKAIATHLCIQAHKDIKIILITPPPVDERKCLAADSEKFGEQVVEPRRTAMTTAHYAHGVRQIGRELGLSVLDIHTTMVKRSMWTVHQSTIPGDRDAPRSDVLESFLHDGLHFTGAAYELLHEGLMQLIGKTWPDQLPENLDFVFPRWDDEAAWEKGRDDYRNEGIKL